MVRDKTVWRLSVIRDGEYRYREINKFRENAKKIVKRRRSCLAKTTPMHNGEEAVDDPEHWGVARMMKCVCPG